MKCASLFILAVVIAVAIPGKAKAAEKDDSAIYAALNVAEEVVPAPTPFGVHLYSKTAGRLSCRRWEDVIKHESSITCELSLPKD